MVQTRAIRNPERAGVVGERRRNETRNGVRQPKQLSELIVHLLKQAGNPRLMTSGLITTLSEHAAGNYRVLCNTAAELLAEGLRRESPQLDEKLYHTQAALSDGRCVLVAEDHEDSATTLAEMLQLLGNEVRIARNGLEAVELASKFRPDLIFLDIGLPGLNGYDACRRIREQSLGDGLMVVALTGWGQAEDKQRSKDAGFDHHLVKPFDLAMLEKIITGQGSS